MQVLSLTAHAPRQLRSIARDTVATDARTQAAKASAAAKPAIP